MDGIALETVTFHNPQPSLVFGRGEHRERVQDRSYTADWTTGAKEPPVGKYALTLFEMGLCVERVSKDGTRVHRAWTAASAIQTFHTQKRVTVDESILSPTRSISPEEKGGARKGGVPKQRK